eukprot:CAMPEP_0194775752 /NCGR_PEP_ID=MMETSP0323_2-20130528/61204_1 /TAXON_ID=2866 ORGANISM="Crypthecodinium cohnii, Strain Seligo" /NCGR_SAMPLE_ID=MMETSP0323_2 /ASSEMBLY_ACC=CAM_ASM_000346 /LENGTH=75 /DNA_ID=CAMNT_0039711857 /DNA_START=38 /DNA_END=262 /DNA_ORIENTATION=+
MALADLSDHVLREACGLGGLQDGGVTSPVGCPNLTGQHDPTSLSVGIFAMGVSDIVGASHVFQVTHMVVVCHEVF